MAKPSLKASLDGVQIAKQALTRAGWTQKDLSALIGCSRQPITNFFKGAAIAQSLFIQICDRLGLNWQEIADLLAPAALKPTAVKLSLSGQDSGLAAIVQNLRQQAYASLRERCGTIRVLDMSHPIEVNELYTHVNILEQITGRRHKRIAQLLQSCDSENFERFGLGQIVQESISGLEAVEKYKKLIILGKPGAGKTTFLKYLAIQSNQGKFEPDRLPVFVTLKDFAEAEAEPSLLEYISDRDSYLLKDAAFIPEQLTAEFYQVFDQGKALVLLDGLDEVRAEDYQRVIKEISDFSEQFWNNQFLITCRIAAWDYTFEKFTEVEVADFNQDQIAVFATKWFQHQPIRADTFLKHLDQNPRIKQLTISPLLLTLVCLAFEESGDCPSNRSELYQEGIDALLKKWDAKRGIHRDQVYQKLSHQRKKDLLSYIAFITFQQKDYFFKQTVVEAYIIDYIRNFAQTNLDDDALQLDSEAILHSIEAQHGLLIERAKGIYSFSHLTFHEYFAARDIVFNRPALAATLEELVAYSTEKRWREVFLLTTEMLRDAALLLLPMQQVIDQLLAASDRLQQFLAFVRDRAAAPEFACFKPAAVRAFYFDIDFDIDENRAVALSLDRTVNLLVCASFLTRMLEGVSLRDAIAIAQDYDANLTDPMAKIVAAASANAVMLIAIKIALDSQKLETDQQQTLKTLLQRLKGESANDEKVKQVADQARQVAKTRHHIGQQWQFSSQEQHLLKQYYNATRLLVDCLQSDGCMINPEIRQQIEATLLLPAASR
ncbi:MAG: NACHT domain-containing NTPase [Aphanocapsa sp. GSE-SYN-MK-11-07L]|jgi:predicted NACHT family NTPase|nr:NACHT domain-containing NTPase [Aphanocapsa sp. GSE-SYN-MK-11-07L]